MNTLMSSSLMVYKYNRGLQRKSKKGFAKIGLPIAKQSGDILEPVSPLVAQRFQAQLEREVKRGQMTMGFVLLAIAGLSAASLLLLMGMF